VLVLGWWFPLAKAPAATATGTFTLSVTLTASCTISAGGSVVNFGTRGVISTNVDAVTVIAVQCTNTTPWSVGMDNGLNASGSQRRMTDGSSNFINYNLYTNSGRTNLWTTTTSASSCTGGANTCVLGTGTGNLQFITVYGRIPAPQGPTPGAYIDTVTTTVTY
jgi:spore coat protein U-like protein